MRKPILTATVCLLWGNFLTLSAQNYLAYNSENVRTTVDGAAEHFFNLKEKYQPKPPIIQSFGSVYYTAQDGRRTNFYGLTYGLAYPISTIGGARLYVAMSAALSARSSNNSKTGNPFLCGFNLPIVSECHFGKPTALTYSVGLGVAYNYMNNTRAETGNYTHEAFGPVAEAAVSVPIAGRHCGVKASYQLNFNKKTTENYKTADVAGVSVFMSF